MRRSTLALMLLAPGAAALAGPATAQFPGSALGDSPGKRITICHATNSTANPYRLVTVAADSILDPRRGVVGHGSDSGTHARDIIPAFSFTWQGRDYEYEGKNLDGDGAELLANRCAPLGTDPVDPGESTWGDDDATDDAPDATPRGGGDDPGDSPETTPFNRTTIKSLDEVAPEGLGDSLQPRTLSEAGPTEAVLRVSIRPSSRRPFVGQRVTFRVTGRALGPAEALNGTLCAAVPSGFSLRDAGSGMVMGRVICWFNGVAGAGATARSFVASPTRRAAGRVAVAPASNSASNAYRAEAATAVRPRLLTRLIAVTG